VRISGSWGYEEVWKRYALFCEAMAGQRIYAAGCCTNTMEEFVTNITKRFLRRIL
jgi:hypothetical protein